MNFSEQKGFETMFKNTKFFICTVLVFTLLFSAVSAAPSTQVDTDVSTQLVKGKSGILIEASTGEVLYAHNPDEKLQIASVTKVMTMLLIAEALDNGKIKLDDIVTVSENAASMGGSQVFLEVGEQMNVDDMFKAIAVASGNDAAVAMAEFIGGTHDAFVEKMNKRATELGCNNTHFINCNGLNETPEHYSTSRDIAIISRELLNHPRIFDYTTIWMDSLRDGKFGLSNTNKLIRFYDGANGLKTGSTDMAKYCLSATAKRDNMQLIAVVLGAPSTAERFSSATALLDYGFANYSVANHENINLALPNIQISGGQKDTLSLEVPNMGFILKKGNQDKIETKVQLNPVVNAPISKGQKIGEVVFLVEENEVARRDITASEDIKKIGIIEMFGKLLKKWMKF